MRRTCIILLSLFLAATLLLSGCGNLSLRQPPVNPSYSRNNGSGNGTDNTDLDSGLDFVSNRDGTCYVNGLGGYTGTDVVIPSVSPAGDRVTEIGNLAFYSCTKLTSVTIPYGVTKIGYSAFYGCTSLRDVSVPDSVTTVGQSAFQGCNSLEYNISGVLKLLGNYNNPYVVLVGPLTDQITSCAIPWQVSAIADSAFYGCTYLRSVTLPSELTGIGEYTFCRCSSLESVTIPRNVKSIGRYAFLDCTALQSITYQYTLASWNSIQKDAAWDLNATNYTLHCTNGDWISDLDEHPDIPEKPEQLEDPIYYQFKTTTEKTELVRLTISFIDGQNNKRLVNVYIRLCPGVAPITVENFQTLVGKAFYDGLTFHRVYPNFMIQGGDPNGNGTGNAGTTITGEFSSNGVENDLSHRRGVISMARSSNPNSASSQFFIVLSDSAAASLDGNYASFGYVTSGMEFLDAIAETELVYGYGFDSVPTAPVYPVTIEKAEFVEYAGKTLGLEFTSNGNGTCTVSDIGSFNGEKLNVPTVSPYGERVTAIEAYAFYNCAKLTEVTIPDSVTEIGAWAFYNCTELKTLTIPDSVTTVGSDAFINCYKLESATLPALALSALEKQSLRTVVITSGTALPTSAFQSCGALTSVTLPKTLTTIGNEAFDYCYSLKSITLPASLTSIGAETFMECYSLTTVTIPNSVTQIGNSAFAHCSELKTILYLGSEEDWDNVSKASYWDWDTGSYSLIFYPYASYSQDLAFTSNGDGTCYISGMGGCTDDALVVPPVSPAGDIVTGVKMQAFSYRTELTSVVLPDTVTSIGHSAFTNCTNLRSITLPKALLTIGNYAFRNCNRLLSVTIPNGVTKFGSYAFADCYSLEEIVYLGTRAEWNLIQKESGWNANCSDYTLSFSPVYSTGLSFTSNEDGTCRVSYIGACTDQKVVIPPVSPDGDAVIGIGDSAFRGCSNLTSVIIPEGVTYIESFAFGYCYALKTVVLPNSLTGIGSWAFRNCTSLANIVFLGTEEEWNNVSKASYWDNNSENYEVVFSPTYSEGLSFSTNYDGTCYVSGIGSCTDTKLLIPPTSPAGNTVTAIGAWSLAYCDFLTSITIPNSVKRIGEYAFYECASLTSISIPDRVTYLGESAFCYCTSLQSVAIPSGVTSIGFQEFAYCESLTKVALPYGVTSIGAAAFYDCSSLTDIYIPDSVTSIDTQAFYGCSSLISVTIPYGVTSLGNSSFFGCSSLTDIYIPDSVTSIGGYAFFNCTSLANVTISSSVTSIGDYAFCDCTSLTSVTIPNSVTIIENYAFEYCSSLTEIIYLGTEEEWDDVEKSNYWDIETGNYILVFSPVD